MAGPLFSGGRSPKFLEYKDEAIFELPGNFKDLDKDAQASIEEQMTNSMMLCLYEKHAAQRYPILYKMFKYPEALTLTTPIQY
ncbi:phosphotransferase enzyme [Aspergillus puulaauensis]|uniref:Phosphotransferase enzyme n=1 Tax=Aspergillus puulaauensis TaxID=1220207 RepID=A0A7R7XB55_9EURO|nr:phosphotransferase enzyme [Aspergillus puulaauensis]BCS18182.1 phosphotransferase enzyme [Aspergillus puulaauensis]